MTGEAENTSPAPILQVHLSRHCNLACRHCYSTSGPRAKSRLQLPEGFYEEAFGAGYRILSLSGGEPYLDPSLRTHVELARRAGLAVNVVSNGTLIGQAWAEWTAKHVDLIAISLDGPPAMHDEIRDHAGAFDAAVAGLRHLRDAGARVAVIHTATLASLRHLRWLVELLQAENVGVLQLHPLEEVGRAATEFAGGASGDLPSRIAYLAQLIQPASGLSIHADVVSISSLPDFIASTDKRAERLAEYLDPLVVEPDGNIVPWTFGIPLGLAVGDAGSAPLGQLLSAYRETGLAAAKEHQRSVGQRILEHSPWPFVNWHGELARGRVARQAANAGTGRGHHG